ncbi:N utilization substance protein A [Mycoplasmopsis mustelae]|uniref:N utilization substance protein A n=1 Tax=Mycoplasmopsis mustelae TaxID=171289 RepID=A0A4R7UDI5_9BACT|nr:transcription termination factor NusA [Mycoplasmopsis mustelae]TDV23300.1 N utilization substance protein A [Mycoplasmopsis mustelae]
MGRKKTQTQSKQNISAENHSLYLITKGFAEKHRLDFDVILNIFETETAKTIQKYVNPESEIKFIADHENQVVYPVVLNGTVIDESSEIEFEDPEITGEPDLQKLIYVKIDEIKTKNPEIKVGDPIEIYFDFTWLTKRQKAAINNGFKTELKRIEKERIQEIFSNKIGTKFYAKVKHKLQRGNLSVEIFDNDIAYNAFLASDETNKSIELNQGQTIEVILKRINIESNINTLEVTMIDPLQVSDALKKQIVEIQSGDIQIIKIQRSPGIRSKVSVRPNPEKHFNFDIIGSIFGEGAKRLIAVSETLGEKIDIIRYSDKKNEYIKNALSPAKIIDVKIHKVTQKAYVIVQDEDLTNTIGKRGINIELASKLTSTRIEVITVEKALKLKIPFTQPLKKIANTKEKSFFNQTRNHHKKSKPNSYLKDLNISMDEFDKDVQEFISSINMNLDQNKKSLLNTKNKQTIKTAQQPSESVMDDLFENMEEKLYESEAHSDAYDFVDDINSSFDINFAAENEFDEFQEETENKDKKTHKKRNMIKEYKKIKDFKVDDDLASYGLDSDIDLSDLDDEWEN